MTGVGRRGFLIGTASTPMARVASVSAAELPAGPALGRVVPRCVVALPAGPLAQFHWPVAKARNDPAALRFADPAGKDTTPVSAALWSVAEQPGTVVCCSALDVLAAISAGAPVRSFAQLTSGASRRVLFWSTPDSHDTPSLPSANVLVTNEADRAAWTKLPRIGARDAVTTTTLARDLRSSDPTVAIVGLPQAIAFEALDPGFKSVAPDAWQNVPDMVVAAHRDLDLQSGFASALQGLLNALMRATNYAAATVTDAASATRACTPPNSGWTVKQASTILVDVTSRARKTFRHDPAGWAMLPGVNDGSRPWIDDLALAVRG